MDFYGVKVKKMEIWMILTNLYFIADVDNIVYQLFVKIKINGYHLIIKKYMLFLELSTYLIQKNVDLFG